MQYFKKNNFSFLIILFVCISINAQVFSSENITTSNGLPNNTVFKVFKDSRGILWIGTNNGLSKIENNKIVNFFKEDGLAHNSVWDITEDEKGNLWFASYGNGITKYNGRDFKIFSDSEGVTYKNIRKIYSYNRKILVGSGNGLFVVDIESDTVSEINTGEKKFQVMDFFIYKNEIYCGAYRAGIFKIDFKNSKAEKINFFNPNKQTLFSINLQNEIFYYGVDGGTSNNTKGAVLKFNIDSLLSNKKESKVFGKSIIWEYALDKDSNLYGAAWGVHTNDGGVYQIKDDRFIDREIEFGIKSNNIRAVKIDTTFNFLYAGSLDNGLYKVDLNKSITLFKENRLDIVDIESKNLKTFFLHKKGLSITEGNKIISEVTSFDLFEYAKNNYEKNRFERPLFGWEKRTSELDVVYHKVLFRNNSLWVSTNIGAYELSVEGEILNYYPILVANFEFDFNKGFINPMPYRETLIFSSLKEQVKKEYLLKDINTPRDISSIVRAENKIYVASSFRGLFVLQNGNFKSLNNDKLFREKELNHLAISDNLKTLVISSVSGDVFLANIENEFKLYKTISKNLIIGNSILFLETYKNAILVGTEKGLNVLNGKNFQFIDGEQGFKSENFTSSKISGDKLIVGTNKGYYELNLPKLLDAEQLDLKLNITELIVNHMEYGKTDFNWFSYNKKDLILNYDENTISIKYKASSHPYPNKLLFSHQIQGLDTTWTKYSNKTSIILPYLPSGKFNINVKVKDLNSGEISTDNLLSLNIKLPFWETWWFILIVFILLLFVGFLAYKQRIKYITNKEKQKSLIQKRIVETKLEALQSQMNPHFTFNAMNSIQNYIIDNDIDNALMYLGEFAKLIRKTLDNSSQPFITLSEEISYLKSYIALENMRHNNSIDVEINYDAIDIQELDIPPMLIQPFVENVFVHAFKSEHTNPKLTITFSVKDNFLSCKIIDNGSGMSDTLSGQMHKSKGMLLVTERLNLLNKTSVNKFNVSSKIGVGTSVVLQLQTLRFS